jgi:tRNA nucleotidyltransferase (CCA-adding enzyme)
MTVKYYQVGGFVRDRLLGVRSKDLDYAVVAPDYNTMVNWIKRQGKIYLEQPEFLTVRAHLNGKLPADFVLCREDGQYSDGRRPDTVKMGTLEDDLKRRDFTVNAIAYDEVEDRYIDPHHGMDDLKEMLLRCVGKAEDRFHEDALRMLRAIRFAITKGFKLHDSVQTALHEPKLVARLMVNISEERKMEELYKCFSCNTLLTLDYLNTYHGIRDACLHEGSKLWLMPTMRDS